MTTIPDYPYRGVPLSPTACLQVLTTWVLNAEPMSRQAILDRIEAVHTDHGGTFKDGKHLLSCLKKALNDGRSNGCLASPRTGYYRLATTPNQRARPVEELGVPANGFDAAVGVGAGAVYVYYLPAYRQFADLAGVTSWPCKVGRSTAGRAAERVREQIEQAPEKPRLALLLCTDEAEKLERHLHSVLDAKGLRVLEAQGGEWFQTSPGEVLSLARETRWLTV